MLTILILWALAFVPSLDAIPISRMINFQKRCNNMLQNPSFESGLSPWLDIVFGPWAQRGVYTSTQGGHDSKSSYLGQSGALVSQTTLTLSQSGLFIPAGTTVDCSAWVASIRPGNVGNMGVELFVDEMSCGAPVSFGTNSWIKVCRIPMMACKLCSMYLQVNGKATVSQDSHTFSIVVFSDVNGPEGSTTWVDDAFVGMGC
jgi:hypothetical protein